MKTLKSILEAILAGTIIGSLATIVIYLIVCFVEFKWIEINPARDRFSFVIFFIAGFMMSIIPESNSKN